MRVGVRIPMTRHKLAVSQAAMSILIHSYVLHICCPAIRQMDPACTLVPGYVRVNRPTNIKKHTTRS
jgi:hypothetical protein